MLVIEDDCFVTLSMSCEASSQVRVSVSQVVGIEPQVSPILTLVELEYEVVGLETFIILGYDT
jgi:hypothetical protein